MFYNKNKKEVQLEEKMSENLQFLKILAQENIVQQEYVIYRSLPFGAVILPAITIKRTRLDIDHSSCWCNVASTDSTFEARVINCLRISQLKDKTL